MTRSHSNRKLQRLITHGSIDAVARGLSMQNRQLLRQLLSTVGQEYFSTVQAMLDSTTFYDVGDILTATPYAFKYRVVDNTELYWHLQTASGNRLQLIPDASGVYNFLAMGPAADGVTDDYPLLRRLADTVLYVAPVNLYRSGPAIYLPVVPVGYFIGSTLDLRGAIHIYSDGHGLGDNRASGGATLIFPPDTTAFILNFSSTGPTGPQDDPLEYRSQGCIIRGINLMAIPGTARDKPAILMRGRSVIENVIIDQFAGDGITIQAVSDPASDKMGNANCFYLNTMRIQRCRRFGIFVDGPDVNAGVGIHIDASANAWGGIVDSSFLGNTWIGCHTESNGRPYIGGNPPNVGAIVRHNGQLWEAKLPNSVVVHNNGGWLPTKAAVEALLVATEPGTDPNVWRLYYNQALGPEATVDWAPAQPVGTYLVSAPYATDNLNSCTVFIGCYTEGDQPSSYVMRSSIVMGGLFGPNSADGLHIRVDDLGMRTGVGVYGETELGSIGIANNNSLLWWTDSPQSLFPYRMRNVNGDFYWDHNNLDARRFLAFTGTNTTAQFGRGTPQPWNTFFPRGFFLGTAAGGRAVQLIDSLAELNGQAIARGDTFLLRNPSPGQPHTYKCTTSGTYPSTAVLKHTGNLEA